MGTDAKKRAAVFLLFGQSNAAGHFIPMAEEEKILVPMKNVFGLSREKNQTFANTELVWSGWTSGGMNLAEIYDHSWSLANCLALRWQAEIDGGADLPDLYIIHIGMGAHGVTKKYYWYPDMEKTMEPGGPWQSKISLYPFAVHLLSLLRDSLEKRGKQTDWLGLHWLGGENDTSLPVSELRPILPGIYRHIFGGLREAAGEEFPIVLHTLLSCGTPDGTEREREDRLRTDYINEVFADLARDEKNMTVFDRLTAPMYDPASPTLGLLLDDRVHLTADFHRWTADVILKQILSDNEKTAGK